MQHRTHAGRLLILFLSLLTVLAQVQNFVEHRGEDMEEIYADSTLSHTSSLRSLREQNQIKTKDAPSSSSTSSSSSSKFRSSKGSVRRLDEEGVSADTGINSNTKDDLDYFGIPIKKIGKLLGVTVSPKKKDSHPHASTGGTGAVTSHLPPGIPPSIEPHRSSSSGSTITSSSSHLPPGIPASAIEPHQGESHHGQLPPGVGTPIDPKKFMASSSSSSKSFTQITVPAAASIVPSHSVYDLPSDQQSHQHKTQQYNQEHEANADDDFDKTRRPHRRREKMAEQKDSLDADIDRRENNFGSKLGMIRESLLHNFKGGTSGTTTPKDDDLTFNTDGVSHLKHDELKFEEEFGMQHADENEATHIHAHAPVDAHGPNLVVHESVQSTKSLNKAKQHEKIVPSMHASLGIDSVHGSKIIHKMDLDEKEFGTFSNLRPPEKMDPVTTAPCVKREEDGLYACLPDVYWIGVSKSGTTSVAQYLHYHPMIKNMVGEARSATTHSKEGHFWEVSEHLFANSKDMIASRIKSMHRSQDGLRDLENRPVFIDYTPNYFVLDHVPKLIAEGFKYGYKKDRYTMRFIVSLREPVSRTLSSWRFKALEHFQMQERKMIRTGKPMDLLLLNDSVHWGEMRAQCIANCYNKPDGSKSMKGCNLNKCRKQYDKDMQETKYQYQKAETSTMCCRTSYYAHICKSLYAYQFAKWFDFFDRSQFFIYTLEEFSKNRIGVLERLLDFLGVPIYDPTGKTGFSNWKNLTDLMALQINRTPRKQCFEDQISDAATKYLHDFFAQHNRELIDVIGFNPYNDKQYKGDVAHPTSMNGTKPWDYYYEQMKRDAAASGSESSQQASAPLEQKIDSIYSE